MKTLNELIPFRKHRQDRQAVTVRRSEDPLFELHDQMNRLFDNFLPSLFGGTWNDRGLAPTGWSFNPRVDIRETKKEIVVTAELPGVEERDLDVSLDDNMLILRGEKREDRNEDKDGWSRRECRYGSFVRTVPLAVEVDATRVDARFRNGVLKVTLPKAKNGDVNAHRVEVKAQ